MFYAGLCDDTNLSRFVHDNFHTVSFAQMLEHRQTVEENEFNFYLNSCGTVSVSSNNHPEVNAGDDFTIPANTYFELSATASDVNPMMILSYSWEQTDVADLGGTSMSEGDVLTDQGSGPLIRTRMPSISRIAKFLIELCNALVTKYLVKYYLLHQERWTSRLPFVITRVVLHKTR